MAKVNVICSGCRRKYRAYTEELDQVRCPQCDGLLIPEEQYIQKQREQAAASDPVGIQTVKMRHPAAVNKAVPIKPLEPSDNPLSSDNKLAAAKSNQSNGKSAVKKQQQPGMAKPQTVTNKAIPKSETLGKSNKNATPAKQTEPNKQEQAAEKSPETRKQEPAAKSAENKPVKKETIQGAKLPPKRSAKKTCAPKKGIPGSVNTKKADPGKLSVVTEAKSKCLEYLDKFVVGYKELKEDFLIGFMSGGHCLLEGVPGVAKKTLSTTMAKMFSLQVHRLTCSPDLTRDDIKESLLGVKNAESAIPPSAFFLEEIDRAMPKVQNFIIETMQNKCISDGGKQIMLTEPFVFFASRYPLDRLDTYPLTNSQTECYMMNLSLPYPDENEEKSIVRQTEKNDVPEIPVIWKVAQLREHMQFIKGMPVSNTVLDYAAKLVRATRPSDDMPEKVRKWIAVGCGPKSSIDLITAAKSRAALQGSSFVSKEDVYTMARSVLRHRIHLSYVAGIDGIQPEVVIDTIVNGLAT